MPRDQKAESAASAAVRYAHVAVPGPHRDLFTYRIPAALEELARPGHRVLVPFGRRQLVGIIWSIEDKPPDGLAPEKIRDMGDVLDAAPVLGPAQRELCTWVARYYRAPVGEVARLAGPPGASWARGPESVQLSIPAEGETVDLASLPAKVRDVFYAALSFLGGEQEGRSVSLKDLVREAGRDALHHRLRVLERAGALSIEWERPREGAALRERWLWSAAPLEEGILDELFEKAPRQAEVYEHLLKEGPSQASALEDDFPGAVAALRALLEKKCVTRFKESERRDPWKELQKEFGDVSTLARTPVLTAAQARALQQLGSSLGEGKFAPFLLWGVTGSGKTEVYLQAIERTLSQGKTALILVPEIALTPKLAARFAARFGESLAILHSGLSSGERFDEWQRLRSGEARVALGVRSAVFAPLANLGLIVIDEEHESTYKQEEAPAYNARDAAVKRAQLEGAVILLGSATPSLESIANAKAGKYRLLELPERVGGRPFPQLEVVDLRRSPQEIAVRREKRREMENPEEEEPWFFSARVLEELGRTLEEKRQAILYLNRRGFASTLLCYDCGDQQSCPNCDVRLRVHEEGNRLLCHYCGYEAPPPAVCPKCRGTILRPAGLGTQQVEQALRKAFPQARVARLDRDALSRRGELARLVQQMEKGEIDFLLGTQMVTKGHDFPEVRLVAVLFADLAWAIPDFRAEERGWQALAQVAGRAGRGDVPGRVLVQTFQPDAPLLERMGEQHLWDFASEELAARKALAYPPAWRLAAVRVSATKEAQASRAAEMLADYLRPLAEKRGVVSLRMVGPAPAPLARLRGRYRWQLLLKAAEARTLSEVLDQVERWESEHRASLGPARISIDVDPQNLM